jgi:hypothetical protein
MAIVDVYVEVTVDSPSTCFFEVSHSGLSKVAIIIKLEIQGSPTFVFSLYGNTRNEQEEFAK